MSFTAGLIRIAGKGRGGRCHDHEGHGEVGGDRGKAPARKGKPKVHGLGGQTLADGDRDPIKHHDVVRIDKDTGPGVRPDRRPPST